MTKAHTDDQSAAPFTLRIDTIEDMATLIALTRDHVHGQQALPGFMAAKHAGGGMPTSGFLLEITTAADFAVFLGIIRGQVVDAAALGEVLDGLARAHATAKASGDRAGGTPASPASGPPSPAAHADRDRVSPADHEREPPKKK